MLTGCTTTMVAPPAQPGAKLVQISGPGTATQAVQGPSVVASPPAPVAAANPPAPAVPVKPKVYKRTLKHTKDGRDTTDPDGTVRTHSFEADTLEVEGEGLDLRQVLELDPSLGASAAPTTTKSAGDLAGRTIGQWQGDIVLQCRTAGAQAFAENDPLLGPLVRWGYYGKEGWFRLAPGGSLEWSCKTRGCPEERDIYRGADVGKLLSAFATGTAPPNR